MTTVTQRNGSRLLTGQQAAREYGIPYTTLRDLIARGVLPEVRLPQCRRLWLDRKDLEALIERSREVRA